MKIKGHGTIKKSKAYGAIGTLLLSGILLTAIGTASVSADETADIANTAAESLVTAAVDSSDTAASDEPVSSNEEDIKGTESFIQSEVTAAEDSTAEVPESTNDNTAKEPDMPENNAQSEGNQEGANQELSEIDTETAHDIQSDSDAKTVSKDETPQNSATGGAASEVTTVSLTSNGFDLQYHPAIASGAQIMFAVWSDIQGQDDLIWYTADKNGRVTAKYTGTYGTYHVHTYQNLNRQMIGLNALSVELSQPNINVAVTKINKTAYKVTVGDAPAYITDILLPTWTSAGGQDDLIWYQSSRNPDGTYSAVISTADHNLESGDYYVHVYGTSAVTNSLTVLKGTTFKNDYAFGDVSVTASLSQNGIYITVPDDVSKGLPVYHAVWSAENGQDDIVWYKVDRSGKTTAKYTGDYGTYHIHTYGLINGRMIGLNAQSIDVAKPNVSVRLTKVDDLSVKVTVSDVPAYITNIVLPTWTSKNNQDDIRWYNAVKASDGTYSLTFYAKDHKFESGHYNVHVYGQSQVTQSLIGLAATDGIDLNFSEELSNPTVTVQNHDASKGTLQVVAAETANSKAIESLMVAAWSQAEQKNIYWYASSNIVNGRVVITVDEKYHHNISGDYTVHAYLKTKDGDTIGYDLRTYALTSNGAAAGVSADYRGTGVYAVSISGVYSNGAVKYAVWSDSNGQDDLAWYDAAVSGTNAAGLINLANHSGTGTYHLHVYQADNGQMYFLTSTDFTVRRTNYETPYYNQRDGRWGSTRYGYYTMASTGCVPTSLAMVFSSLTGNEVLPTAVADYLYNNTVEFNRGGEGTTGRGILMASNQWGMSATVLNSPSDLTAALQEGHHVLGAVQQNKFSPWGWGTSHELVLKGYSNGSTYVFDPYNASNNGWYPIASLWNEQSTQSGDTNGLGRPFVKITDA